MNLIVKILAISMIFYSFTIYTASFTAPRKFKKSSANYHAIIYATLVIVMSILIGTQNLNYYGLFPATIVLFYSASLTMLNYSKLKTDSAYIFNMSFNSLILICTLVWVISVFNQV